jgi:hypothetical protein
VVGTTLREITAPLGDCASERSSPREAVETAIAERAAAPGVALAGRAADALKASVTTAVVTSVMPRIIWVSLV